MWPLADGRGELPPGPFSLSLQHSALSKPSSQDSHSQACWSGLLPAQRVKGFNSD